MLQLRLTAILLAAVATACTSEPKEPADLVLRNGRIVTVDSTHPEVQALAIKGDRILALGSNSEMASHVGKSTQVIDLGGNLAIPGLIEGHGHYMNLGRYKTRLDLAKARNWDEIVAMVKDAAANAPPGAWISGRGWHQEKWDKAPEPTVDGVPLHASLDAVSPDNPVLLTHASGHGAFANGRALAAGGITRATRNPPGGEIVHDSKGEPTGYLREVAQRPVSAAMSKWEQERPAEVKDAEFLKQVQLAGEEALSHGITSFQDAGASFGTIDRFKQLAEQGKLPVRLYVMARDALDLIKEKLPQYRMIGVGNNFLTVRSIKMAADGALGSNGAWLLKPYEDLPTSTGLATTPVPVMTEEADVAIQHDFQVNVHAIGDRANREVLDLYEKVMKAHPDKTGLRWRIEHAQHLDLADIPRFGKLGVIAAMQGIHATSDGPWVPKRLGMQRAKDGAYVWQSLMKSGAIVTNGTDVPVEQIDPIASYYASVSRKLKDGSVFFPDQRMSRMEALKSYTWNNAYAAFEEDLKGSLAAGKLADITVLSKDILTIPEDSIPTAKVVYTILGGKVAYKAVP